MTTRVARAALALSLFTGATLGSAVSASAAPMPPSVRAAEMTEGVGVPSRSDREPYRLVKIGRSSVAPVGKVEEAVAPSLLLEDANGYAVWSAGVLRRLAPSSAQAVVSVGPQALNGRGDVAGSERDPNYSPGDSGSVRWLADGTTQRLGTLSFGQHGWITASGASATVEQFSFRYFRATLYERDKTEKVLREEYRPCTLTAVSDNGVAVGMCGSLSPWALPTLWASAPLHISAPSKVPDARVFCQLSTMSSHAKRLAGTCTYLTGTPTHSGESVDYRYLWNAETGAVIAEDVPYGVIDIDDTGRVLINTGSGPALWSPAATTPLSSLVRLSSRESLTHARFDENGDIVAILSSARTKRTVWQAVRLAPR